jgi:hypothetical protein
MPSIVAHDNGDLWIHAVALFEFHVSGSGVTELFRLGSPTVAFSFNLASVRAGKHLEDEFDTTGSFGFQS